MATRGGEGSEIGPQNHAFFSQGGWTFEVNGSATASDGSMTLAFSKGGYQEARGSGPSASPSLPCYCLCYIYSTRVTLPGPPVLVKFEFKSQNWAPKV